MYLQQICNRYIDNRINYGPVLENIVYRYARSLGYEVSVGRIGKLECDFIMRGRDMGYSYVQVAMTIMGSEKTEDREYRPLEQIRDNYPKFVITRADPIQRRNGICQPQARKATGTVAQPSDSRIFDMERG